MMVIAFEACVIEFFFYLFIFCCCYSFGDLINVYINSEYIDAGLHEELYCIPEGIISWLKEMRIKFVAKRAECMYICV